MTIETIDQLNDQIRIAAGALQQAALAADGTAPFSEQAVLSWAPGADTDGARHLLARTATGIPVGYAYLDAAGSAEFAVDPAHRRQGHGRALLELLHIEAADAAAGGTLGAGPELRIWAHGDHPAARALAASAGYRVVRELLQLRRSLDEQFPGGADVKFPGEITVRSFQPGVDETAWLRLNAKAFAQHPEQGRTTLADLQARMAQPWFDPAGFLIAEQDGTMVGFHWTKVHPDGLGEVYVLGVDPERHGGGLGRALTLAGLKHLYDRGLRTVLLYVESDNAPALAVYHRLGFTTWKTDVMYAPNQVNGR
ncbi:MAG TPA: mycothiol synthase [Kineosporiaceae bacterium]|nr:mycothiol synthase [Kineosporiaceae bacterium]